MIRLELHNIGDIKEEYANVFTSVFKEWVDQGNCPTQVYYGYDDDKFIGFISGFPLSQTLWYLQRTGYVEDEQSKVKNLQRTKEVFVCLHRDWPFILTLVRNDDITMLKMSLSVGFKIIGTRIDTQKTLWVEMMSSKEDING